VLVSKALMAKITGDAIMMRASVAACCWSSGLQPATSTPIRLGARMVSKSATDPMPTSEKLISALVTRQALSRSFRDRYIAKTGMNAAPTVPPASTWNTVSGTRMAARNVSYSRLAPYCDPMTMFRTSPSSRLATTPVITISAAERRARMPAWSRRVGRDRFSGAPVIIAGLVASRAR
jgi:hypothetical protein